jgi:hypothetical protein
MVLLETGTVGRATEGAVVGDGVVAAVEEGIQTMTGMTDETMVEIVNLAVDVMKIAMAAGVVATMTGMITEEGTVGPDIVVAQRPLPSYRPL